MANREKGEFEFEVKGVKHVLLMNEDAICDAEAEVDLGIEEMVVRLQRGANLRIIRAMIRTASQGRLTREQVSAIIKEIGVKPALGIVIGAYVAANPPAEESPPETDTENPPVAAAAD